MNGRVETKSVNCIPGRVFCPKLKKIEGELVSFLSSLFNESSGYHQALVDKALDVMPNVREDVVDVSNNILDEEACRSMKEFAPRRSHGIDGLGAAFLK